MPSGASTVSGEVSEVGRDDGVCATAHRRSDDVTVVGVRQGDRGLDRFPSFDERILEGVVHRGESLGHPVGFQVGVNFEDRVDRLGEDAVRPERSVELPLSDSQECVCERDGHEDARVQECRVERQESLAVGTRSATPRRLQRGRVVGRRPLVEPQLACLFCQLVQRCAPFLTATVLEVEDVLQPHATMSVRLLERDRPVLEELDERRPADPEEIRGFLGGEEQALRGHEGRLALTHHLDYMPEDSVDLCGKGNLLTVRSEQKARLRVMLDEAREVEELIQVLRRKDELVLSAALCEGIGHDPSVPLNRKNRKLRSSLDFYRNFYRTG